MISEKIKLLHNEMAGLQLAADHLAYSLGRCQTLTGLQTLQPDELERLESMTARFARLSDLLIQRIFRLVDDIELVSHGSVLDRIYRSEKRGWANATEMIRILELRNLISHEYATEQMSEIYATVASMAPFLQAAVQQVSAYVNSTLINPAA